MIHAGNALIPGTTPFRRKGKTLKSRAASTLLTLQAIAKPKTGKSGCPIVRILQAPPVPRAIGHLEEPFDFGMTAT